MSGTIQPEHATSTHCAIELSHCIVELQTLGLEIRRLEQIRCQQIAHKLLRRAFVCQILQNHIECTK